MTILYLIRHGETDWNILGRYQGQADPPLNNQGLAQSKTLAESLRNENIDIIYTSPLMRARQTAEIISNRLGVDLVVDPRFMEIHQGDWQMRLRSEIEALYPELFSAWENKPWDITPPAGESLHEVAGRVESALEDILERYPGLKVVIVTHRIPIALLKVRYQNLDRDIVRTLTLQNTYWEKIDVMSPKLDNET
jgi:broad specificity phosphatase PhoE